ncbi:MAG: M23 family metallopeptidase [Acidobacteriota bacterium]
MFILSTTRESGRRGCRIARCFAARLVPILVSLGFAVPVAAASSATGSPPPSAPADLECRSSVGGVALRWSGSRWVDKYTIQRGDGAGGLLTSETTEATFFDDQAPLDLRNSWRVRAVAADGTESSPATCSATPVASASKPFVGPPRVFYEDRVVLTFAGATEARTRYEVTSEMRGVPEHLAWQARLLVGVFDADDELVAELASPPAALAPGDQDVAAAVEIDALALGLPVGSYVLRGTVVATPASELPTDLAGAVDLIVADVEPALAFLSAADDSLRVLDRGDDAIAAYWTAIHSGNADTAFKATSSLLYHYRDRGLFHEAEQQVALAADVESLRPLGHILRYWAVDDRLYAGDHAGAVQLLGELMDQASPRTSFFGEAYRARGLYDLAGLQRRVGKWPAVHDALRQLTTEFPGFHRPTVQIQLGESALELGDTVQATAVFEQVVESQETCKDRRQVCPTLWQVERAQEWLDLLASPRDWMRPDAAALLAELEAAVVGRDMVRLEALVPPSGLDFVVSGGEHSRTRWSTLRPFFADVLALSPDLGFEVKAAYGPRQSVVLSGIAPEAGAGPTRSVALTAERTPLGWQWKGVGGVLMMLQDDAADGGGWDPCSEDPTTGAPVCEGPPSTPNPTTPPGGAAARLHVEAPWAAGSHMRAGGLSDDLTAVQNGAMGLDFLMDLVLPVNDRCGNSVPGYLYGLGTHTNEDHFAIDFTQGYTLFCVWGVCITPPGGMLLEVIQAIASTAIGQPVWTPAFDDPVLAAREGLVIDSDCSFDDGNSDDPNRVEVAVWDAAEPLSIARLAQTTPTGTASKGTFLAETEADYWLRYLHLRKNRRCPSRGTWVEQGRVIGHIDDSGNSFTSHLHFVVRHRPAVDPQTTSNWPSARQVIHGDFIGHRDNGSCIKSHNRLNRSDRDGDGILDAFDNCTVVPNPDQLDADLDMIGDACDDPSHCPFDASGDFDSDGTLDPCDPDIDGDGIDNEVDICVFGDNGDDFDIDGEPDGCDRDVDGDDFSEACEEDWASICGCLRDLVPDSATQAGDHDGDGVDSLSDPCPCSDFNPTCEDLADWPPPGLGGAAAAEWGEPYGPGAHDPYGAGGSPHGPGGQYP